MKRIIFPGLLLISQFSIAQFKADNVKYTTVFPEDLCKTLMENNGYIFLDVRSNGEFDDTLSSAESLNIGHIKGAKHIDIRQLAANWKELNAYKDKPLFIYCSHSQRSRRASRLLADSGFTKIFNINGGLTNFYEQGIQSNPCANYEIVSSVAYKIISPRQMVQNLKSGMQYFIIDLRNDSAFNGISKNEKVKAEGRFESAVSIPFAKLAESISSIPKNKTVLLVDEFGNESPKAAKLLTEKGFKDLHVLFDGMDSWIDYITSAIEMPVVKWKNSINYNLLSADRFNKMVHDKKDFVLIDVRTRDEFNNKSKNYWQNIGNIKTAVNIPFVELNSSALLPASKTIPVIIHGFNADNDIFNAAKLLKDLGYQDVNILQGGIWNLRWTSHNIKGKTYLNELVENVPQENQ
jgi:rhodanese-related sulfurtransferase